MSNAFYFCIKLNIYFKHIAVNPFQRVNYIPLCILAKGLVKRIFTNANLIMKLKKPSLPA